LAEANPYLTNLKPSVFLVNISVKILITDRFLTLIFAVTAIPD